jgi:hypothetical protein
MELYWQRTRIEEVLNEDMVMKMLQVLREYFGPR